MIDGLGVQMIDDGTVQESSNNLPQNPAYRQIAAQHKVQEDAIEHMAVIHCDDLTASVISVGHVVARQFSGGRKGTKFAQISIVLLNKIDLAEEEQVEIVAKVANALNAKAEFVRSEFGKVSPTKLHGKAAIIVNEKVACGDAECTDTTHSHSHDHYCNESDYTDDAVSLIGRFSWMNACPFPV